MHKLYKITNLVNQKCYVGITKLTLNERWVRHLQSSKNPKYPLHRAIKKYGPDSFQIELIEESLDRKLISDLEEPTILQLDSRNNGYNVAKGGYGGDLGPEANAKRRQTVRNRTPEEKSRISKIQSFLQTGRTKENDPGRRSQSEKIKGNKFALGLKHTEETKRRISESNRFSRSLETRHRMSTSAIINENGKRFAGRRASCLCCHKEWDIGNFTQHIKREHRL